MGRVLQLSAPNALINFRNVDKQIGYILHEERRGEEMRDKNMPPLHHQTYNWKQIDHLLQTPCCWWLACTHPPMIVSNYTITSPIIIMPPTFRPVLINLQIQKLTKKRKCVNPPSFGRAWNGAHVAIDPEEFKTS